ncbi:hypothetical protein C1I98_11420 [Spongiactinospora gelatinilytica]|uniref:DUF3558 domain-containing protein n=1 Tax=Spongiactinospora gelatinilytica TaxID=2666298 RepID=A0A2W2H4K9_9ACTN|nr:hypothetical protein [Spongiactinospora gelatinilytica]PZG49789.1 hypothetical protein C1I98_11420 [Spongiactinospora gelatinilytica]
MCPITACAPLRPESLEIVPGIDARSPDVGFGGWKCGWRSTTSDTWVDLRFDRDQPPSAGDDGTPARFNDYPAFVEAEGDGEETCLVQVVYRSYTDDRGRIAVEKVRLAVGGSRPTDRLCQMARGLAGPATARLRAG